MPTPHAPALRTAPRLLVWATLLALTAGLLAVAPPASAAPIEDYASYEAGDRCRPKDKRGAVFLGRWMVRKHGGGYGGVGRSCSSSTSEHEEGRAFDWTLDARRTKDRKRAAAFMERIFATDERGNPHAWARRMGVMYVIWNDHMWSAWDTFEKEDYLSSSCESRRRCSASLRHRDHLHISLTRRGGRGATSWFERRMDPEG